uniref:Type I restriction enzyme endonuclease subunit n=1 Tax=Aliivibrio fischeri TaxID=668 RepID=H2ERP9_ALIFS|nr:Type I restriction-modification system, restriction subunit R [Aliivibrio fischeri]
MIDERQLELNCIDWFESMDYRYLPATEVKRERGNSNHQIILKNILLERLEILNPDIAKSTLEDVVEQLNKSDSPVLIKSNRTFHKWLIEGVKIEAKVIDAEGNETTESDYVQLIDFANIDKNDFLVTNQFTVIGTKGELIPDVVVFINGLPISVIELKNPADEQADIWDAFNQLQTYKEQASQLFVYNEALVISDGLNARVGSLTANEERFVPWRVIEDEEDRPNFEFELKTLVKGFFKKEHILDFIRYFILFEPSNKTLIKKIASYHQFHAVRAAVDSTVIASDKAGRLLTRTDKLKTAQGSGKAGVVWHTQGSGKSISMVCYASKLLQRREMSNPTIVVVTDRNDLDQQLYNTFCMAAETLKQMPIKVNGRDNLRDELSKVQSGGIIFTTVQKFQLENDESRHPELSTRSNIIVMSDEAHRSQYGNTARLKNIKDKDGNITGKKFVYGYSKYMREALPQASFIGFTGTPIEEVDKDTQQVFGPYVSVYDIQDAIDDGTTVPIYYESRIAKLDVDKAELERLNIQVEQEFDENEEVAQKESIKAKWAALEKLVGSEPRLKSVAADLVKHYETRCDTFPGKAIVVGMSREICVDLYNEIIKLRPEWHSDDPKKGGLKIIMTGSSSDKAKFQPHIHNKKTKKDLEDRYKDVSDELKIVIVRDMWLTGFDAPCCHTMYIDKPMRGHNLMQAIARVNRVFGDKEGGLVVDYIGIAGELKEALKTYTNSRSRKDKPTINARQAFEKVEQQINIIRDMFETPVDGQTFEYLSTFEQNAMELLPAAVNHLTGLVGGDEKRDGKRRYLDAMAMLTKAYSLCNALDEIESYKTEIAFYFAVKAAYVKLFNVDKKRSMAERSSVFKVLLDNALSVNGVDDIFSLVGLDKPNISLLSEEFLEDVKNMQQQNLAVELLEKLLKDEVKARLSNDVVQEKKYSDRILSTLQKYHNRSVETAQVIAELISWAKEMAVDAEMASRLNLSTDEIAFYRALVLNEESVLILGDDNLRQLAIELTRQLRKSATVDWNQRDSVRARMRNLVRRLLKRWKYPPEDVQEAIDIVLAQAEALADGWANNESQQAPILRPFTFGDKKLYFYDEVSALPGVVDIATFTLHADIEFEVRALELNMFGAYQDLIQVGVINREILEEYFLITSTLQAELNKYNIDEYSLFRPGVIWSIKEVRKGSSIFEIVASISANETALGVGVWYSVICAFRDTGKALIKTLSFSKVMVDRAKVKLSDKAKKDLDDIDKNKH